MHNVMRIEALQLRSIGVRKVEQLPRLRSKRLRLRDL